VTRNAADRGGALRPGRRCFRRDCQGDRRPGVFHVYRCDDHSCRVRCDGYRRERRGAASGDCGTAARTCGVVARSRIVLMSWSFRGIAPGMTRVLLGRRWNGTGRRAGHRCRLSHRCARRRANPRQHGDQQNTQQDPDDATGHGRNLWHRPTSPKPRLHARGDYSGARPRTVTVRPMRLASCLGSNSRPANPIHCKVQHAFNNNFYQTSELRPAAAAHGHHSDTHRGRSGPWMLQRRHVFRWGRVR
jgi:hypothetical protein